MQRAGILLLVVGLLAVAAAYLVTLVGVASDIAPWWLASGTVAVFASLATLGAAHRVRPTPILKATLVISFACLAAGFFIPLLLPPPTIGPPLLFGLPRQTALLVILVYVVPLIVMPIGYGLAFDREVLPPDEFEKLRESR